MTSSSRVPITKIPRVILAYACRHVELTWFLIFAVLLGCNSGSVEQSGAHSSIDDTEVSITPAPTDTLPDIAPQDTATADTAPDEVVTPIVSDASPWRWTPGENLLIVGTALHGDVLYVLTATNESDYWVELKSPCFLYATNARTGRVLWRSFAEGPLFFAPSVDRGRGDVIVSSNNDFALIQGRVLRFSSEGSLLSMYTVPTDMPATGLEDAESVLRSEPAIAADGTAYFMAGRTLNALLPSGVVAWTRRLEDPGLGAFRDVSVLLAGKTVVAFEGRHLYFFGTDGSLVLRTPPIEPASNRAQRCGIRGRRRTEIIVPSTEVWAFGLDGALSWKNTPVWGAACPVESSSGQLVFFDDGGEQQLGASTASWMNEVDVGASEIPSFTTPSWHQLALEGGEVLALHRPVAPTAEYSSARSAIIYRPGGVKPIRFELPVAYSGEVPPLLHAGLLIYASKDSLVAVPLPKKAAEGHWYTTHGDFANTRRLY